MKNKNSGKSGDFLIPFWEKKPEQQNKGFFEKELVKKIVFYLKLIFYTFSGTMIFWSFIQSFAAPYTNYDINPGIGLEFGYLPGKNGTGDVRFDLGSWSLAGPKYHAFFKPTWIYGPFLSFFVYPVAKLFLYLIWVFSHTNILKRTGLDVIFSMLIIMCCVRFITFWSTLRSSKYQEKQLFFQSGIDSINAKYEKFDPWDKQAKLRKHQEITAYNKKHNLKPFAVLENVFINTPIFLIVFKLITITRPIKFTTIFGIWDLSKTPSNMVFTSFLEKGWMYLLLCLAIIPVNLLSQKSSSILSKLRHPNLKKKKIDKNSQEYKMGRIQKIMTLIFLVFTFFWSTGLAIYYFFNSIFTIFQNLIIHLILLNQNKNRQNIKLKLQELGLNA